jgi:hypothetical protein
MVLLDDCGVVGDGRNCFSVIVDELYVSYPLRPVNLSRVSGFVAGIQVPFQHHQLSSFP